MRSIWKGAISFGLVTIPVAAYPAISAKEKIKFRMLRKSDHSPIKYMRVAEADGQEVPWGEIVKGYEYEKGQYVIFEDKDLESLPLESADAVTIQDFVDESAINPMFYDAAYYLEPAKGGAGAYALLRDALQEMGKVGIAKVAMRSREHLAAVRPEGHLLILETMHFAHEVADATQVKAPEAKQLGAREKEMAKTLIEQMSAEWEPSKYKDEYADAVMKLVEKKIAAGGKSVHVAKHKPAAATNVVDLVSVLQASLKQAAKPMARATGKKAKKRATKKAA